MKEGTTKDSNIAPEVLFPRGRVRLIAAGSNVHHTIPNVAMTQMIGCGCLFSLITCLICLHVQVSSTDSFGLI